MCTTCSSNNMVGIHIHYRCRSHVVHLRIFQLRYQCNRSLTIHPDYHLPIPMGTQPRLVQGQLLCNYRVVVPLVLHSYMCKLAPRYLYLDCLHQLWRQVHYHHRAQRIVHCVQSFLVLVDGCLMDKEWTRLRLRWQWSTQRIKRLINFF